MPWLTTPLVSTHDLAMLLAQPTPPVLLDVRWRPGGPPGRQEYGAGHLPGAVYVDLDTELAAEPGADGRHPLPDPAELQGVLCAAGVHAQRPVVVYDVDNGSIAARAWWLLRWAGHDQVSVLDGGLAAWAVDGFAVTTARPHPEPGDFEVRPGGMPVIDACQAAAMARSGVLVDARAPERYRGEVEPLDPSAGHIPGAINAPFGQHVGADGRWRPPIELAARFAALGVSGDRPIGTYCGSGVTAASVVLALEAAEVTTRESPAALYAGSWSHWCTDPDRPVATGDQPG